MGKIKLVPYLVPHLDKNLPVFRGSVFLVLLKEAVSFSNVSYVSVFPESSMEEVVYC